jgi:WD40 repeat protein
MHILDIKQICDKNSKSSYSPYLASGSTDKTIRVWKISLKDKNVTALGNDGVTVSSTEADDDFAISEYCVFRNEEAGFRKLIFLKSHPHLILAGDLVRIFIHIFFPLCFTLKNFDILFS